MPVVLRLTRRGAKKNPIYRIVATDSKNSRDGKFIETIGQYNPHKEKDQVTIKKDRVDHWVKQGAQVSDTVRSLLNKLKTTAGT